MFNIKTTCNALQLGKTKLWVCTNSILLISISMRKQNNQEMASQLLNYKFKFILHGSQTSNVLFVEGGSLRRKKIG